MGSHCRSQLETLQFRRRRARAANLRVLASALLASFFLIGCPLPLLFAILPLGSRAQVPVPPSYGRAASLAQRGPGSSPLSSVAIAAAATTSVRSSALASELRRWLVPSPAERLSPREWLRMYRLLGLPEGASRQQVAKAAARLRKKYEGNTEAIERIENAHLWIMTGLLRRKEEAQRQHQRAARRRELGDVRRYVPNVLPSNLWQFVERPSSQHFRVTSGWLGLATLVGTCVPNLTTNVVAMAAIICMGLVYQRNRPELVRDEFGNPGEVRQVDPKEMIATVAFVAAGGLLGALMSLVLSRSTGAPFQDVFLFPTCAALYFIALSCKVHRCFHE